jgi:TIR domain
MKVFVSYSENEFGKQYVAQFCELLKNNLEQAVGKGMVEILFDGKLGQGDNWRAVLEDYLRECNVYVPLYATNYFKSDMCGKELAFFRSRIPEGLDTQPIFPVLWSPLINKTVYGDSVIPIANDPLIDNLQYHPNEQFSIGQLSLVDIKQKGLCYYLKNSANSEIKPLIDEYLRLLIERIAIINNLGQALNIQAGKLDDFQPIFCACGVCPKCKAGGLAPDNSPDIPRINIVVMAAKPTEVTPTDYSVPEAYRENGGDDWRPFWPEKWHLGKHFQQYVGNNNPDAYTTVLPFSNVKSLIEMAENEAKWKRPFFFVVDPATAQLPQYALQLEEFSKANLPYCAILAPGTASSVETNLISNLQQILAEREVNDDPIFKTYFANTPDELELVVNKTYELISSKFRKRFSGNGGRLVSPFQNGTRPSL